MSPEEITEACMRGLNDPTLKAVIDYVHDMTAITVGESSGFWTARTCNEKRDEATAKFVVAMEKLTPPEG